jgi:hypothetical protein
MVLLPSCAYAQEHHSHAQGVGQEKRNHGDVDEWPAQEPPVVRNRASMYPLDEWLVEGNTLNLTEGKDFDCDVASFVTFLRGRAKREGLRLGTKGSKTDRGAIRISVEALPEQGEDR